MRCAVVGHVEWVEFARVPRDAGARARSSTPTEVWAEPAGGGAVVARQLALLAGRCELFTALGDDELGPRGGAPARGARRRRARRAGAATTRRAWTHVDADGERTITVLGDKLLPRGPLPLDGYDLVFFVSGDVGGAALGARGALPRGDGARAADAAARPASPLDLLVASANDPGERYDGSLDARHVALTDGAHGGTLDGEPYAAAPRRRVVDTYGAGDSSPRRSRSRSRAATRRAAAVALAARAGAAVIGGAGPVRGAASVAGVSARVSWISLTPVKATMLHLVDEAELLESGVRGDRRFYLVDERGRLVSNKDHGPLQLVHADYDEDADTLSMRFPDGERA